VAVKVFPVVSRLCAPIEGTDAGRLADCLGLDGSKYRAAAAAAGQGETREDASLAAVASLDDDDRWVGRWVGEWCEMWLHDMVSCLEHGP
jgi:DNA polymerase alpha subunit A